MSYKILLASNSPRRREILSMLRIPFTVVTLEGIDESYPHDLEPEKVSEFIANKKADEFLKRIGDNDLIITADTIVICDGKILGKPKDSEDAAKMLMFLSGKTHMVTTGVTVATKNNRASFTTESYVKFADLTEDEIRYYVDTFHPLDKAGAYGIQEWIGAVAVAKIDGSFYNVMGLPVHRLYQVLKNFKVFPVLHH
ncbi:MAG: septum formation protein Maf [Muribaculaceae bacterium]|nr:septum formation protein Maf [Muribaculaceae bacterium]